MTENGESTAQVRKADATDLDEVARLFDLYRQFYDCEPDLSVARSFIKDRMDADESTIFVAAAPEGLAGFVQLYPSFCSVQASKIFILYDLYVDQDWRGQGVGEQLMVQATEFARANGAERVDLETDHSNLVGQRLYEKLGFERTLEDFHAYSLQLNK